VLGLGGRLDSENTFLELVIAAMAEERSKLAGTVAGTEDLSLSSVVGGATAGCSGD